MKSAVPSLRISKTIERLKHVRIDFQFGIQTRLSHYCNRTDAYFIGIGIIKANQCNIVRNFQTQRCNTLNSHNTNLANSKQNGISLQAGAVSKQFILFLTYIIFSRQV